MTNHDLDNLTREFCKECRERMLRARDVLEKCTTEIQFTNCCDLLYQEFDTMCGGARAINFSSLEKLYSGMTKYSRFLRNKTKAELTPEHRHLMIQAIELSLSCCGNLDQCLVRELENIDALLGRITEIMEAG